jgi:ATP-dependent DNA ligase
MDLSNLIEDIKGTSKPSEKQDVLRKYESKELKELLVATYDPFLLFNVSITPKQVPLPGEQSINDLFDEARSVLKFCEKSKSNKQNREMVVAFLEKLNAGSQALMVGTLNKNWKAGIGTKTMLKVFPGLVKQFLVQLANTYDPKNEKHTIVPRWLLSNKLDGMRCIALRESSDENYDKGRWTLYSRTGKEFLTVEHLKPELEAVYRLYGYTFFDGELYKHGLKFEEIQGPVMAHTQGQVRDMEYHIFIAGNAEKFLNQEDPNHVDPLGGGKEQYAPHLEFVSNGWCSAHEVEEKLEEAFEQGYEGIMLRDPDQYYDYKRSNALLKLKSSLDEEEDDDGEQISDCVVESIEYNDFFPVIEDGKLHTERLLNKVWVIQEDGVRCKVGTGYSLDFRRKYTQAPYDLIGKTVEVKHQGYGKNGRMRFPRLYRVREDL